MNLRLLSCSVIFCEATAIYGVILSIILTNKVREGSVVHLCFFC